MSAVSGIACVLGSAIICVDVIVRKLTHRKFQIANSSNFLAASLCLSAGAMLFTSLTSMLPTSEQYLTRAGLSARAAAFTLTGLFLAGVFVIRTASSFIHRYIPSHVVDCAHTHEEDADLENGNGEVEGCHHHGEVHAHEVGNHTTEYTPLLLNRDMPDTAQSTPALVQRAGVADDMVRLVERREPLRTRLTRRLRLLMGDVRPVCDENGSCYGFSQACGSECRKILVPKTTAPVSERDSFFPNHHSSPIRPASEYSVLSDDAPTPQTIVRRVSDGRLPDPSRPVSEPNPQSGYFDNVSLLPQLHEPRTPSPPPQQNGLVRKSLDDGPSPSPAHKAHSHGGVQHHHHVPQNAFLSIGLQTSLAIALHKLPEGFITYATNHASPTLGVAVFLALFIHNISEGFAMALPLYLALHSRWKAMFWSSLLGGISQPLGAGIAALWIWGAAKAGQGSGATTGLSWGVYGGMFAATSGVMVSVALQLLSEGLSLTHNRNLATLFVIAGMGIMGLSFALTA